MTRRAAICIVSLSFVALTAIGLATSGYAELQAIPEAERARLGTKPAAAGGALSSGSRVYPPKGSKISVACYQEGREIFSRTGLNSFSYNIQDGLSGQLSFGDAAEGGPRTVIVPNAGGLCLVDIKRP